MVKKKAKKGFVKRKVKHAHKVKHSSKAVAQLEQSQQNVQEQQSKQLQQAQQEAQQSQQASQQQNIHLEELRVGMHPHHKRVYIVAALVMLLIVSLLLYNSLSKGGRDIAGKAIGDGCNDDAGCDTTANEFCELTKPLGTFAGTCQAKKADGDGEKDEEKCEDSDGDSVTEKGVTKKGEATQTDYCFSETSVNEFVCENNEITSKEIQCPDGYNCAVDKCIEKPIQKELCVDEDNTYQPYFTANDAVYNENSLFTKANVIGYYDSQKKVVTLNDNCIGPDAVQEVYCYSETSIDYKNIACPSGYICDYDKGACVQQTQAPEQPVTPAPPQEPAPEPQPEPAPEPQPEPAPEAPKPTPASEQTCTDPDNTYIPNFIESPDQVLNTDSLFVKTTVTGQDYEASLKQETVISGSAEDKCNVNDNTVVVEGHCYDKSAYVIVTRQCPSGNVCDDGACVKPKEDTVLCEEESSCGTEQTGEPNTNINYLYKTICNDDGTKQTEKKHCPLGCNNEQTACKEQYIEPTKVLCVDTDATDSPFAYGSVIKDGVNTVDSCTESSLLKYYCDDSGNLQTAAPIVCQYGCSPNMGFCEANAPIPTVVEQCDDPDKFDITVQGTTTDNAGSVTDDCNEQGQMVEYYCHAETKKATPMPIDCPVGQTCSVGVCACPEGEAYDKTEQQCEQPSCVDEDESNDKYTRSKVVTNDGAIADICGLGNNNVKEAICVENKADYIEIICELGCKNGACLLPEQACRDYDNTFLPHAKAENAIQSKDSLKTKSYVTINDGEPVYDKCQEGGGPILNEQLCTDANTLGTSQTNCQQQFGEGYSCNDGRCVECKDLNDVLPNVCSGNLVMKQTQTDYCGLKQVNIKNCETDGRICKDGTCIDKETEKPEGTGADVCTDSDTDASGNSENYAKKGTLSLNGKEVDTDYCTPTDPIGELTQTGDYIVELLCKDGKPDNTFYKCSDKIAGTICYEGACILLENVPKADDEVSLSTISFTVVAIDNKAAITETATAAEKQKLESYTSDKYDFCYAIDIVGDKKLESLEMTATEKAVPANSKSILSTGCNLDEAACKHKINCVINQEISSKGLTLGFAKKNYKVVLTYTDGKKQEKEFIPEADATPTDQCTNGVKDSDEEGIDCGEMCGKDCPQEAPQEPDKKDEPNNAKELCQDSDGGEFADIFGKVTIDGIDTPDSCNKDKTKVIEQSCSDIVSNIGVLDTKEIACEDGSICDNGACKIKTQTEPQQCPIQNQLTEKQMLCVGQAIKSIKDTNSQLYDSLKTDCTKEKLKQTNPLFESCTELQLNSELYNTCITPKIAEITDEATEATKVKLAQCFSETYCVDSNPENIIFKSGVVIDKENIEHKDSCKDGKLIAYSCNADGTAKTLPDQQCSDGCWPEGAEGDTLTYCKKVDTSVLCQDTDTDDKFKKGTVTVQTKEPSSADYTDFCSKGSAGSSGAGTKADSSFYVYEYFCKEDGTSATEIYQCAEGSICIDGSCVAKEGKCVDGDNTYIPYEAGYESSYNAATVHTKSSISGINIIDNTEKSETDYCTAEGQLAEGVCTNKDNYNLKLIDCLKDYKCSEGACVLEDAGKDDGEGDTGADGAGDGTKGENLLLCKDTDAANLDNIKGEVFIADAQGALAKAGEDSCQGSKIIETTCLETGVMQSLEPKNCPANTACLSGACEKLPESCEVVTDCPINYNCEQTTDEKTKETTKKCVKIEGLCTVTSECTAGEECLSGTCVKLPEECTDVSQCPKGLNCNDNKKCEKVAGYCESEITCLPTQECTNNVCVCPQDSQFNIETQKCEVIPVSCSADTDCKEGKVCKKEEGQETGACSCGKPEKEGQYCGEKNTIYEKTLNELTCAYESNVVQECKETELCSATAGVGACTPITIACVENKLVTTNTETKAEISSIVCPEKCTDNKCVCAEGSKYDAIKNICDDGKPNLPTTGYAYLDLNKEDKDGNNFLTVNVTDPEGIISIQVLDTAGVEEHKEVCNNKKECLIPSAALVAQKKEVVLTKKACSLTACTENNVTVKVTDAKGTIYTITLNQKNKFYFLSKDWSVDYNEFNDYDKLKIQLCGCPKPVAPKTDGTGTYQGDNKGSGSGSGSGKGSSDYPCIAQYNDSQCQVELEKQPCLVGTKTYDCPSTTNNCKKFKKTQKVCSALFVPPFTNKCFNKQKDTDEGGVDCGGTACNPCPAAAQPKVQGLAPAKTQTGTGFVGQGSELSGKDKEAASDKSTEETEEEQKEDEKSKKNNLIWYLIAAVVLVVIILVLIAARRKHAVSQPQTLQQAQQKQVTQQQPQQNAQQQVQQSPMLKATQPLAAPPKIAVQQPIQTAQTPATATIPMQTRQLQQPQQVQQSIQQPQQAMQQAQQISQPIQQVQQQQAQTQPQQQVQQQSQQPQMSALEQAKFEKLKQYAQMELQKGFTKEQVKQKLMGVGWKEELIEHILEEI